MEAKERRPRALEARQVGFLAKDLPVMQTASSVRVYARTTPDAADEPDGAWPP